MKLKDACISRDGKEDGEQTYKDIIEECQEAAESGSYFDIEEILHDAGFEPDYLLDVIHTIA